MNHKNDDDRTQDLINNNRFFSHILKYKVGYLSLILFLVLLVPAVCNFWQDKPIIMGVESYYHLSLAESASWYNINYFPLKMINLFLVDSYLFLIPLFLAFASLWIFLAFAKKVNISEKFTFFFAFFLVINPAFIYTYITLSTYSFLFFLLLLGFFLYSSKNKFFHYISLVPFLLSTFFDIFSGIILLLLFLVYLYLEKKKVKSLLKGFPGIVFVSTFILIFFNILTIKIPFVLGPFNLQDTIINLVSDLGGLSGTGIFILFLALIGLAVAWKSKNYSFSYVFLLLFVPVYFYSSQTIFHLSLLITFFATVSFVSLFETNWNLELLKKFTFFLLILGILFSTLTYLDRVTELGPSKSDFQTLTWIKDNVPGEKVVFSTPENSYYITYFAKKTPLNLIGGSGNQEFNDNITDAIFASTYTTTTFPIFEENDISIIYITEDIRNKYSAEQGLLFLLKNERFKLVHSHKSSEVWLFTKELAEIEES